MSICICQSNEKYTLVTGDKNILKSAEVEASLEEIKGKKKKDDQTELATNLNICGNFIVLLGDTISALVAQQEAEEIFENPKKVGSVTLEATRDNLIGEWLNVIGDVFNYRAAVLISSVS